MADNYLEKRYEEVFGSGSGKGHGARTSAKRPGLDTLLRNNRSYREYDCSYEVMEAQLEAMVRVNTLLPSGRNAQSLRFRMLTKRSGSEKIRGLYKLGRALPELHLPRQEAEPQAFIVICSTAAPCKNVFIDLGISCQAMLLKAAEMGLQGVIICNFDPAAVREALALPLEPLAIVAVGKGLEKIELVSVEEGSDLNYYRRDGIHYVPKLRLQDLLI